MALSNEQMESIRQERNRNNVFARFLGIETTEIREGFAESRMLFRKEFQNVIHSCHGGCLMTLADTTGGAAVASHGTSVTTVSLTVNFLKAALDTKMIYCRARELHSGKRLASVSIEVFDDRGTLLAAAMGEYAKIHL